MQKKYPFLFLILCACTLQSWATANIGFGTTVLSADTVKPGDTVIVYTSLINYGPQAFNGPIGFNYAINGVQNVNRAIFNSSLQGQSYQIQSGDSLPVRFRVSVQDQYLLIGPDIFVVWPILPNSNIVLDSLFVPVTVVDPSGVDEMASINKLKMYYLNQSIIIENLPASQAAQLSIFDMRGRMVYTSPTQDGHPVHFNDEDAGVYLAEVSFANGERKAFKIVKP